MLVTNNLTEFEVYTIPTIQKLGNCVCIYLKNSESTPTMTPISHVDFCTSDLSTNL